MNIIFAFILFFNWWVLFRLVHCCQNWPGKRGVYNKYVNCLNFGTVHFVMLRLRICQRSSRFVCEIMCKSRVPPRIQTHWVRLNWVVLFSFFVWIVINFSYWISRSLVFKLLSWTVSYDWFIDWSVSRLAFTNLKTFYKQLQPVITDSYIS